MSRVENYVAMTLSGTPGTGNATLNSALASPNRSFLAAFGAVSTSVDVEWFSDAAATAPLGIERVVYDGGSPGTLIRGTAETPGALVSLPAGASVRVANPASAIDRYESAGLEMVTGPDASVTLIPDTCTVVDLSSFSADRDYTLPTTARAGQEVALYFSVGSGTRKVNFRTGAGQTLAYGGVIIAAASLITCYYHAGEHPRVKYLGGDKWTTVRDGRIAGRFSFSAPSLSVASGAIRYPGTWTVTEDNGNFYVNATNDHALIRRPGNWNLEASCLSQSFAVASTLTANIAKNAATTPTNNRQSGRVTVPSDRASLCLTQLNVPLVAGDSITAGVQHTESGTFTFAGFNFNGVEVVG